MVRGRDERRSSNCSVNDDFIELELRLRQAPRVGGVGQIPPDPGQRIGRRLCTPRDFNSEYARQPLGDGNNFRYMSSMPTIEDIIDRLGGPEPAARLTGVTTEAVRKWRHAGAVPSRHWAAVSAATGLPMDELRGETLPDSSDVPPGASAALVLADGAVFWGRGFGAHTGTPAPVGEICFNTGMTGYQETLTDPSYAGQIITFTFSPHRQRRHQP